MDSPNNNGIARADQEQLIIESPNVIADKYEILEPLGRGGMGVVYRARQFGTNREVAVKTLLPTSKMNEENVKRFEREVRVICSLEHPNTVNIYDAGALEDGTLFFVMELLKGRSLSEEIRELGPMEVGRAIHIISQMLKSLAEAHSKGIVHRDLKPENIWLLELHGEKDFVKVLDFGVAKTQPEISELDAERVTQDGTVFGTPAYMGPEQLSGGEVGPWTDIYALGHLLYRMINGKTVYGSSSMVDIFVEKMSNPNPNFDEQIMNGPVGPIILKATAHEVEDRYQSAEEMLEAVRLLLGLERHQTGEILTSHLFGTSSQLPKVTVDTQPMGEPEQLLEEEFEPTRSKAPMILLILLLIGGAIAFFAFQKDTPQEVAPAEPAETISVKIISDPVGAEVYLGEELVGKTPMTLERTKAAESLMARVELDGFEDHSLNLSLAESSSYSVNLKPLAARDSLEKAPIEVAKDPEPSLEPDNKDNEIVKAVEPPNTEKEPSEKVDKSENSVAKKEKSGSRKAKSERRQKEKKPSEKPRETPADQGAEVAAPEKDPPEEKPAIPIFEEKTSIPTLE